MAVVFDTGSLARHERADALATATAEEVAGADVRFTDPRAVHGRFEEWIFGPVRLLRAELSGLEVVRTSGHIRASRAGILSIARQFDGVRVHEQFGVQEVLTSGLCGVLDMDTPFVSVTRGPSISASLRISLDELGLPRGSVRAAALGLRHSPLHPMVSTFIADTVGRADDIESDSDTADIGGMCADLIRALVFSAAGGLAADGCGAALPGPLLLGQIESYLRSHLGCLDLTAAEVAAVHNISERKLYRLWADAGRSMRQWVIAERLELARRILSDPQHAGRTIGGVARTAGFRDASHFTRRFRATYGVGPREWRAVMGSAARGAGAE
ncbi:AraC family transcriptional regulator [Nocardia sp. NPDC046763]|uniref:AraC family transcriptional regulator n=1 Tax=Nocardia sp. NPDC046763 TaxID=3155256 RepID=UPI0034068CEB